MLPYDSSNGCGVLIRVSYESSNVLSVMAHSVIPPGRLGRKPRHALSSMLNISRFVRVEIAWGSVPEKLDSRMSSCLRLARLPMSSEMVPDILFRLK